MRSRRSRRCGPAGLDLLDAAFARPRTAAAARPRWADGPPRSSSSATMRSRSGSAATKSGRSRSSPRRPWREGADTLMSVGGVQSNSARVVAAVAARAGPEDACSSPTAAARPADGATRCSTRCSAPRCTTSSARGPGADDGRRSPTSCAREGRRPFEIPLGASTPLGALGFARGVGEMAAAGRRARRHRPRHLVGRHAGGTGRGLRAARPAGARARHQRRRSGRVASARPCGRDRRHGRAARRGRRGDWPPRARSRSTTRMSATGYGVPTPASARGAELLARHEAMFVDHTYTAKALAGLIRHVRRGTFSGGPDRALLAHGRAGGVVPHDAH